MVDKPLHSTDIVSVLKSMTLNVSRIATQAFVPGNVITNGQVYYQYSGGVRIEDDIITETGGEVVLIPRELI